MFAHFMVNLSAHLLFSCWPSEPMEEKHNQILGSKQQFENPSKSINSCNVSLWLYMKLGSSSQHRISSGKMAASPKISGVLGVGVPGMLYTLFVAVTMHTHDGSLGHFVN